MTKKERCSALKFTYLTKLNRSFLGDTRTDFHLLADRNCSKKVGESAGMIHQCRVWSGDDFDRHLIHTAAYFTDMIIKNGCKIAGPSPRSGLFLTDFMSGRFSEKYDNDAKTSRLQLE
mgnify:CR=1 FL=1